MSIWSVERSYQTGFPPDRSTVQMRRRVVAGNQRQHRLCGFLRVTQLVAAFLLPRLAHRIKAGVVVGCTQSP